MNMLPTVSVVCLLLFAISLSVDAAPQFGAYSQSNAQAGAFGVGGDNFGPPSSYGGGFGPQPGPGPPPGFGLHQDFGPNGYGPPNSHGGPGHRNNRSGGLSISVSKSISIGGGGAAQSSSTAFASGK